MTERANGDCNCDDAIRSCRTSNPDHHCPRPAITLRSIGIAGERHAVGRIQRLERELANYKRLEKILENYEDVTDGDEGQQLPNAAMSYLTEWRGPL